MHNTLNKLNTDYTHLYTIREMLVFVNTRIFSIKYIGRGKMKENTSMYTKHKKGNTRKDSITGHRVRSVLQMVPGDRWPATEIY